MDVGWKHGLGRLPAQLLPKTPLIYLKPDLRYFMLAKHTWFCKLCWKSGWVL